MCSTVRSTSAQPTPLKGMVWTVPADVVQAEQELRTMRLMGVEAVRTDLVHQEHLLDLADTLGIQFFQELPIDDLPATALADTLPHALSLLTTAITNARNHPSARHFGLARRSDTSDPRACAFFEKLAEQVHRLPHSKAYYLSAFVEADQCAATVNFVLLDALDAPNPATLPMRWRSAHPAARESSVGLGALGTWVKTDGHRGLHAPHSPERQARYLESNLRTLLAARPTPYAVFVYRWQDVRSPRPSPAYDLTQPYQRNYGVITTEGIPRLAQDVVRGFYSGTQTVFAFPTGITPISTIPWPLLFGWMVFILIAVGYALSPRFRYMVPRYFLAHGFYREAIREGREVLLGSSVVLLIALALSAGVFGSIVLETVRREIAFRFLFQTLPDPVQIVVIALMSQPWMMVLLLGSFYALGIALWTSVLSFASRRRQLLIPGQALMLVLWARWPFPLLMAGAMVVPTLPEAQAVSTVVILTGAWLLLTFFAIIRTLRDYAFITYSAPALILAMAFVSPLSLLLLVALFITVDDFTAITFFWHLATLR